MKIDILCGVMQKNILQKLDADDRFDIFYYQNTQECEFSLQNRSFPIIIINANITDNILNFLKSIQQYNSYIILLCNELLQVTSDLYPYIDDFILYPVSSDIIIHKLLLSIYKLQQKNNQ